MSRLRAFHLWFGVIALLVFLGTGMYMNAQFPAAYRADEVVRYLYRASHVYILFVALLHLVLAAYLVDARTPRRRRLQRAGSLLLLAAVPILVGAFFVEPPPASPQRPLTLTGVILVLSGTVFSAGAGVGSRD